MIGEHAVLDRDTYRVNLHSLCCAGAVDLGSMLHFLNIWNRSANQSGSVSEIVSGKGHPFRQVQTMQEVKSLTTEKCTAATQVSLLWYP